MFADDLIQDIPDLGPFLFDQLLRLLDGRDSPFASSRE